MSMDRLSLKEVAEVLGISEDGVRKRVKRGSIPHDRDEDGKLYVYLDASETEADMSGDASGDTPVWTLVDQLRSENEYLREESRRKDHIIAGLVERIPELEAPAAPEPRESPETASPRSDRGTTPEEQEEPTSRPWWRRFFGLDG